MVDRAPELVARLQGLGTTVFTEMTELAQAHGAVNLGQGFPDDDPPDDVVATAQQALADGHNQYAPGAGVGSLRAAIAAHQRRFQGLDYDVDDEITVCFGATEGLAAAILSVCEVGDEVLLLEPAYDTYRAMVRLAGAVERPVPMRAPDFRPDLDALEAAIGPRTRMLVLNTPHNPTGTMLTVEELDAIAALCVEHDLLVVTDEVYEHLTFGAAHVSPATRPGMRERTMVVSSAAKTLSVTGWKIGWVCAPPRLTDAVRIVKQYVTFSGGTPLQHAVAAGMGRDEHGMAELAEPFARRREVLCDGLEELGVALARPQGTYFALADLRPLGHDDGAAFCRWAPAAVGLAAVPVSAFVDDPSDVRPLVRLAFCKSTDTIERGLQRLADAKR